MWKIIAWVIGLYVGFNVLLLVVGYAAFTGQVESHVTVAEENVLIEESE